MIIDSCLVFIDFEVFSFDLIVSYLIEVGFCMFDGILYSWLIVFYVLWQDWFESVEQIYGIFCIMLEVEGIFVWEVVYYLNELLFNQVFCDVWMFDSFWLYWLFWVVWVRLDF